MPEWRKKIAPPCPKCNVGGYHQGHEGCPQKNGYVWIDILTGACQCNACNQTWMLETSIHYCNRCNAIYKGGEIWMGMSVEIARINNLSWMQKIGIKRGVPKIEFIGWRKKKNTSGCFISSAVFHSMGNDDNCKELTTLRNFRDGYLLKSKNGEHLVEEYYRIAPTIVAVIDSKSNSDVIYKQIYDKHLTKCLNHINKKEYTKAIKVYKSLIYFLQSEYL